MTGEFSMRVEVEVLCGCVLETGSPDGPPMRLTDDVEVSNAGVYRCSLCGAEVCVRMRVTN